MGLGKIIAGTVFVVGTLAAVGAAGYHANKKEQARYESMNCMSVSRGLDGVCTTSVCDKDSDGVGETSLMRCDDPMGPRWVEGPSNQAQKDWYADR